MILGTAEGNEDLDVIISKSQLSGVSPAGGPGGVSGQHENTGCLGEGCVGAQDEEEGC